ncbi:MAG TPA: lytic transglycosylase domain-containing protein, partial [Stellaceae bacterium]|nr:lytic transglycosylase domain-containing protein [Stellaceae bacterium]
MSNGRTAPQRLATWTRAGIVTSVIVLATLPAGPAEAEDIRTAALTPPTEPVREADLPNVLSTADAARYRRIFTLEAAGNFPEADREIARLDDRLLVGAVLAQRYLDRRYHEKFQELADWLAHYADEPDARDIYELALKRRPANARLTAPTSAAPSLRGRYDDASEPHALGGPAHSRPLARALLREATWLKRQIRRNAHSDPVKAESLWSGAQAKRLLSDGEREELQSFIAEGYLDSGDTRHALELSEGSHDRAYASISHWHAGLAAWRLGQLDSARKHFQALARDPGQSSWTISAAAFWAARVELKDRQPQEVDHWLGVAAAHPYTFYGLLARHTLGVDTSFDFDVDPFTDLDAQIMTGFAAGRRASALVQVGEIGRAELELRRLAAHASPTLLPSLAALADRANMPALSFQLAQTLTDADGRYHVQALYPLPRWTPRGGFTVDRAFLFALMRQESQFLTDAESSAGAVGLMQLMPATARLMAERTGLKESLQAAGRRHLREALADPALNLSLAQEFLATLL